MEIFWQKRRKIRFKDKRKWSSWTGHEAEFRKLPRAGSSPLQRWSAFPAPIQVFVHNYHHFHFHYHYHSFHYQYHYHLFHYHLFNYHYQSHLLEKNIVIDREEMVRFHGSILRETGKIFSRQVRHILYSYIIHHLYRTQVSWSDLCVWLSLTKWETLLKLYWCDSGWWRYKLDTNW